MTKKRCNAHHYLRDGLNQLEGWEGLKPVLRAEPRDRMVLFGRRTRGGM